MSDSRREVTLVDLNHGTVDVLRYVFPNLPVAYEGDVTIPGYPRTRARVIVYRNAEVRRLTIRFHAAGRVANQGATSNLRKHSV